MMRSWLAPGLVVLLLAACHEKTTGVPATIPSYRVTTLDGQSFTLPDTKGRVLLLNIWATWCAPCRAEIPELNELQKKYAGRKFDVIGVNVDLRENEGAVRRFAQDIQINYPVVLDPEGKMASLLNAFVLPTSALVDRSGKVVWLKVGVFDPDDDELRRALNRAL